MIFCIFQIPSFVKKTFDQKKTCENYPAIFPAQSDGISFFCATCKVNKTKAETFSQNALIAIRAYEAHFVKPKVKPSKIARADCENNELLEQKLR